MSQHAPALQVHVRRRVHDGLAIDVALTIDGPSCVVLFGPSGVGKTTLLRLLAGLDRPDRGLVRLGETTLFDSDRRIDAPLRSRRIGMIFQHDLLFPHLDVAANVRFGLRGRPRREADARVDEVAGLCGIGPLLGRRPETLSGGERQRVGLARALAPGPRLLLADEPVSALDLAARSDLISRLRSVQRREGIPLVYVTHSPSEAIALGDRLVLMRDGRIVDDGPPLDVLARPRDWPVAPLHDVRNRFAARVASHDGATGETHLALDGGPVLLVPRLAHEPGAAVSVSIRADDILLARADVDGVSARNRLAGLVERVVGHGGDAEVLVRTGELTWIVSVVETAATSLALAPGAPVRMIVKARSCHVEPGP